METLTPRHIEDAAARFVDHHRPGNVRAALVAGSGITLGLDGWQRAESVPYAELVPFPVHELLGHTPRLTLWRRDGESILAFDGRFHLYQGYTSFEVAALPRLAALAGAPVLIATNAAGSLDPDVGPGSLVVVRDHLNLQGANPLVGEWGRWREPVFPDMTEAYDPGLRGAALRHAAEVGFKVTEGVYASVLGPSYETPAEIGMMRTLGATVVGMSTVQEVIAARHMGMRVAVLSLATNLAAGIAGRPLTHQEVIEEGAAAREKLVALLDRLIDDLVQGRV